MRDTPTQRGGARLSAPRSSYRERVISPPPDRPRRVRWGVGAIVVVGLGIVAVTVAVGLIRSAALAPEPVPAASVAAGVDAAGAGVYVHVAGAVAAPGLYLLPTGARVFDAVSAAGGLSDTADAAAVNLARPVTDGEQLHVPAIGETAAAPPPGERTDGKIDLNTADLAQLDELPRIGPAIAQRIIDWREQNGRFTSVDDLLAVPGIGEKLIAGLRDLVTV